MKCCGLLSYALFWFLNRIEICRSACHYSACMRDFFFVIFLLVSTKTGALAYCFMRKPGGFLRLQRCTGGAAIFASLRVNKRFENDAQARPAISDCLSNRQIARSARGCCDGCYRFRRNLWISWFFGVCGWGWGGCLARRWADEGAVCFWGAHVCLHDFAYQIGKPPAAPVNTAKYAINSVEICG